MKQNFTGFSSALSEEMNELDARLGQKRKESELVVLKGILDVAAEKVTDLSEQIRNAKQMKGGVQKAIRSIITEEVLRCLNGCMWCPRYVLDKRAEKEVLIYNGKFWVQVPEQMFGDFVNKCARRAGMDEVDVIDPEIMTHLYNTIIFSKAQFRMVRVPDNEVWINLKNGTLEIRNDGEVRLREHRPEDGLRYVLPYSYDPNADCEMFKAFLDQMLPYEGVQDLLAQFIGFVFTHDIKLEKMLVFYGFGSNGKSVIITVLDELFGKQNVSEVPLNELTNDATKLPIIENKLLNLSSENMKELNPAVLKTLVSGEPVIGKKLYSDPYTIYNYAKFIASFNKLPKAENTHGFFRRLIIVPFNVTISDAEADVDLPEKLCQELPGILNWAIQGLKVFLKTKKLAVPDVCREAMTRYVKMSDSVHLFLDEMCQHDSVIKTSGPDLYKAYRSYCRDDGMMHLGKNNFYERLVSLGVERTNPNNKVMFNVFISNNDRQF